MLKNEYEEKCSNGSTYKWQMSSGGATVVHAEEPSQAFTLDPMVVTATRYEKRDVDVPASTTVLTGQEL